MSIDRIRCPEWLSPRNELRCLYRAGHDGPHHTEAPESIGATITWPIPPSDERPAGEVLGYVIHCLEPDGRVWLMGEDKDETPFLNADAAWDMPLVCSDDAETAVVALVRVAQPGAGDHLDYNPTWSPDA